LSSVASGEHKKFRVEPGDPFPNGIPSAKRVAGQLETPNVAVSHNQNGSEPWMLGEGIREILQKLPCGRGLDQYSMFFGESNLCKALDFCSDRKIVRSQLLGFALNNQ
jgi:hypothetical protein